MNRFTVLAFYTEQTPYEQVMQDYLLPSLKKFELPHIIKKVKNQGSWHKNTCLKPYLIEEAFKETKEDTLVMLDADTTVEAYPTLFNEIPEEFDIAVHYLDWDSWYLQKEHISELMSCTLFIRNNERTKKLLKNWKERLKKETKFEQLVLQDVIKEQTDIKVYELPLEYCYITSMPDGSQPNVVCKAPIICQHQISRQLKRKIQKT